jgi:hypothetical protein
VLFMGKSSKTSDMTTMRLQNEAAGDNLEVKGPVRSQQDPPNTLG